MSEHDRYRDLTAAYVLGALEVAERAEIESHLESCELCREDVVAFAPLPSLLGRLDVADLVSRDHRGSADAVVSAVRDDVARLDRSRRRWRWVAGAAASAAIVFGVVVAQDSSAPERSDGVVLELDAAPAGATASIVADERAWGTYVHVSARDLPRRESYALWVVDDAGSWHAAGSWAPTPDGVARLGASSRLHLEQIDRVVITSADRDDELLVAR